VSKSKCLSPVTFFIVAYSNIKSNTMKKLKIASIIAGVMAMIATLCAIGSYAQKPAKLTDPEIASVAVVANQNDIDFAAIAKQRSKNTEVLNFAQTMANDHQSVIDQAVALVTKLKVTPKDNELSKSLTTNAANTKKMLLAKSAESFDKAYIDNEVAYHKAVISTVETVLIPQAANAELKALLQQVLPTLKAHLEHAQMVQKTVAAK
jgi:putative membrane protein